MFFIEYRDPLFGIIIFFTLVFIISFANYWWGVFKSKEEKSKIEKFIKKFEINSDNSEYKILLQDHNLSAESIILLAISYTKSGDYEKAIEIYLHVLQKIKSKDEREYVLSLLGKTYFKAGFLYRARDIFMETLRFNPRNKEVLKYLIVIYEKVKDFKKAREVLSALQELGVKVDMQKSYILAREIVEDKSLKQTQTQKRLLELCKESALSQRVLFEFYAKNKMVIELKKIEYFDFLAVLDILWYLDADRFDWSDAKETGFILEILSARGIQKSAQKSEVFELDILINLNKYGYKEANLGFEYICLECKHLYPIYFYRCPNCLSLGSAKVQPTIVSNEKDISFQ